MNEFVLFVFLLFMANKSNLSIRFFGRIYGLLICFFILSNLQPTRHLKCNVRLYSIASNLKLWNGKIHLVNKFGRHSHLYYNEFTIRDLLNNNAPQKTNHFLVCHSLAPSLHFARPWLFKFCNICWGKWGNLRIICSIAKYFWNTLQTDYFESQHNVVLCRYGYQIRFYLSV